MSIVFLGIVAYLGTILYQRSVATDDPPVPVIKAKEVEFVCSDLWK